MRRKKSDVCLGRDLISLNGVQNAGNGFDGVDAFDMVWMDVRGKQTHSSHSAVSVSVSQYRQQNKTFRVLEVDFSRCDRGFGEGG